MLPLLQAEELRTSILEYLKATFAFKEKDVYDAFYAFIEDSKEGLFKGPYLDISLPFVKGDKASKISLEIQPPFTPWVHQAKSFERLSARNKDPQPTLLTTGTGSGKTESFLYPILDYCYANRNKKGIKAIILYPMNALATDQAGRLAEAIFADERLKGTVSAGLFIGEGSNKVERSSVMSAKKVIENRDAILDSPPDILLTNFKMLDYALLRSKYHSLWIHNLNDSTLLRFLVLDELHTYDGAQGTDVANLIRRLKLKLEIELGQLCPVGTSATIGKGEDSGKLLVQFAEAVFGEKIAEDAVIIEERVSAGDFFKSEPTPSYSLSLEKLAEIKMLAKEDYDSYLRRQKKVWGLSEEATPLEVGDWLNHNQLFRSLVSVLSESILHFDDLCNKLADINLEYKSLPEWDDTYQFNPRKLMIESLISLLSYARSNEGGRIQPFLYVRVQFWVRELSSLFRLVNKKPQFVWRDNVKDGQDKSESCALPMYFCRECGASGWIGRISRERNKLYQSANNIIRDFIAQESDICLINTNQESHRTDNDTIWRLNQQEFLDSRKLTFLDKKDEHTCEVVVLSTLGEGTKDICPECEETNVLASVGTRLPTLLSIATSQSLSSNLDSKVESERRALVFTNQVQDAAHTAGFIQSRNFRFTLRTSIQQVVNESTLPISLTDLLAKFELYWKNHSKGLNEDGLDYYRRFYPGDLDERVPLESYIKRMNSNKSFEAEFRHRLQWDILAEYGFSARIGRTLEKSGASLIYPNFEDLEEIWDQINPWLQANNLEHLDKEHFEKFIAGVFYRMRTHGALDHVYLSKFRSERLNQWDLNWNNDNRHYLNKKFGSKSRFPKLLTTKPPGSNPLDSTFTKTRNWYHEYFTKSFRLQKTHSTSLINEFFIELFTVLVEKNWCNVQSAQGQRALETYALNPSRWLVSNLVDTYECDVCGHQISVAEEDGTLIDASCQQYRCTGSYTEKKANIYNYYRRIYDRTSSPRVYAGDHTGIIERKSREDKESRFKGEQKGDPLNVLVATSTLEMGIDIGDLDVTMNAGVPPLASNFIQRVGRAGRKSGNSLITNFAKVNPHDLYFFEEPMDIMDGVIHTPGCFLNSPEILSRQFLAYCFDSWSTVAPDKNNIPEKIFHCKLTNPKFNPLDDPSFFLAKLVSFVDTHSDRLIFNFEQKYEGKIEPSLIKRLSDAIIQRKFEQRLFRPFQSIRDQLQDLTKKRKAISKILKERKLDKNDPDYKELKDNQKALYRHSNSLRKQQTLEMMTNAGLLPNYAFPETGVTLLGTIYQPSPKGNESEKPKIFERSYVRPSSQALRELAPGNTFYSEQFGYTITGLNISDWSTDESTLSRFRFCSQCDHYDTKIEGEGDLCPKCGHASYGATSNIHDFARITGVIANDIREDAYINDKKEDRWSGMYEISRHFNFQEEQGDGSLALVDVPFGIEFAGNVRLLESNLGYKGQQTTDTVSINEHTDIPKHGFITCRHCGFSVTDPLGRKVRRDLVFHYPYCNYKNEPYKGISNDVFSEVYLYHEKVTEVLKILLPVQSFASDDQVEIFKSGLELGIKQYYQGQPSHINFFQYKEYNKSIGKFDRYLLLYDRVPGGTGYLKKLFNKDSFTEVLSLAYKAISDCTCQHEGKDGCYHCVRSYGNQHKSKILSRKRAEEIFKDLCSHAQDWQEMQSSLSDITRNGKIEESELEDKFLFHFRLWAEECDWKWEEKVEQGIRSYYVVIPQLNGTSITYWIQPQVSLSKRHNIQYSTRADFLIQPIDTNHDNKEEIIQSFKKIAVYLDGYQYHASRTHNNFKSDVKKREGILQNPKYRVWVLTWDDLENMDIGGDPGADLWDLTQPVYNRTAQNLTKNPNYSPLLKQFRPVKKLFMNSFLRLMAALRIHDSLENQSFGMYSLFLNPQLPLATYAENEIESLLNMDTKVEFCHNDIKSLPKAYSFGDTSISNELFSSRLWTHLESFKMHGVMRINDNEEIPIIKEEWVKFWQLFNIYQYSELKIGFSSQEVESSSTDLIFTEEELYSLKDEYDEVLHPLIDKLVLAKVDKSWKEGVQVPLSDGTIAEASIGFLSHKVVFDPFDDKSEKAFKQNGIQIGNPLTFDVETLNNRVKQ